ncbi:hypothetical protein, partial [Plesiomonas shigelloides]|uniref:hypothetical protein n=1 Tax=Plesiomonas shigelloides TaxID=703 RepID=UPI0022470E50
MWKSRDSKSAPDFTHNHSGRSAKRKDTLRDQQDFFYEEKTRASQREGKENEVSGTAGAFFHRLRPPDELHRKQAFSGAQVRSGET